MARVHQTSNTYWYFHTLFPFGGSACRIIRIPFILPVPPIYSIHLKRMFATSAGQLNVPAFHP